VRRDLDALATNLGIDEKLLDGALRLGEQTMLDR
jgi:hypothetical protein